MDLAAIGHEVALLARVGEERHRRLGVDEDEVTQARELHHRQLGDVGKPFDRRQPGAAFDPGGEHLGEERRAGERGDLRRREQPRFAERSTAEQDRRAAAAPQGADDCLDRLCRWSRRDRAWHRPSRLATLAPRHVRGENERRHLAGRPERRGNGLGRISGHGLWTRRGPHPRRDVPGNGLNIGLQLRVVLRVVGRVVADDVDDRHLRPPGVVEVGQPIAETGPEVQQGGRGPIGHPRITVRRPGGHPLEQRQHAAHLRDRVERSHEMHLRGPGIREARGDAGVDECADECLGAVGHVRSVGGCFRRGSEPTRQAPGGRRFRCRR